MRKVVSVRLAKDMNKPFIDCIMVGNHPCRFLKEDDKSITFQRLSQHYYLRMRHIGFEGEAVARHLHPIKVTIYAVIDDTISEGSREKEHQQIEAFNRSFQQERNQ